MAHLCLVALPARRDAPHRSTPRAKNQPGRNEGAEGRVSDGGRYARQEKEVIAAEAKLGQESTALTAPPKQSANTAAAMPPHSQSRVRIRALQYLTGT